MSIKQVLAGVTLAALAGMSAQAAEVYIAGSVGASRWKVEDPSGTVVDTVTPTENGSTPGTLGAFNLDKNDTGGKIAVGVQLHPNFALEGGYTHLGKAKYSGALVGDIKGTGWFVDAVGVLPMTPELSGLVRLGAFRGKAKGSVSGLGSLSDSGTDVKYGLGLQYALSRTLAVRGEWERYRFDVFDDKGDVDLWSLGVKVTF